MVDVSAKAWERHLRGAAGHVAKLNPEEFHMLSRLINFQVRLRNSERGATAVEYGLMVALIAIVIIVAVTLLGSNLSSLFNTVATSV
jgi:pilus assembly protein Flp/PilA